MAMNANARVQLVQLIKQNGVDILNDPKRLHGLLLDKCPDARREINVLLMAIDEKIPYALRSMPSGVPQVSALATQTQRLADATGLTVEAAQWSVETWAIALGILTPLAPAPTPSELSEPAPVTSSAVTSSAATSPSFPGQPIVTVSRLGFGQFKTIKEAQDQLPSYGRIILLPGLYKESLTFLKSVEIVGNGPSEQIIIEGKAECRSGSVSLRGISLQHPYSTVVSIQGGQLTAQDCSFSFGGGFHTEAAIEVSRKSQLTLQACRCRCEANSLKSGNTAIRITDAEALLEDTEISVGLSVSKRKIDSYRALRDLSAGVLLVGTQQAVIRNCNIIGGDHGILFDKQAKGDVLECVITGSGRAGILATESSYPVLQGCHVKESASGAGICLEENTDGNIENCTIEKNLGPGILIRRGANPVVRNCKIFSNVVGVCVNESGAGLIENCDLRGNRNGSWDIAQGCYVRQNSNIE